MVNQFSDFFERFVEDFSWKRIAILFSFFCIILLGVLGYESYTSHFKLNKIQKQAELLEKITNIGKLQLVRQDQKLQDTYNALLTELENSTGDGTGLAAVPNWLRNFLAAAMGWTLFTFVLFLASKPGDSKKKHDASYITGILIFAIPFSIVSAFIPTFKHQWINYYFIPAFQLAIALGVVVYFQKRLSSNISNT